MGSGSRDVSRLRTWARQRPRGSERWVLEELDTMQSTVDADVDPDAERDEALEILVRRGVLSAGTAAAARTAPIGASAGVLPPAAPRPPRPIGVRAHDPGAIVGSAIVGVAPLALLLPPAGLLDLGASMWVATGLLLAGMLVVLLSGGRGSTSAPGGRGHLSSRAAVVVALVGLVTPIATLVAAVSAGRFAPEYFGACLAYQSMSVFFLFAAGAIVRHQERAG
ncbi:hypothetical protein [Agromyces bauzanensis]